jgi:hypothetical protein
MGLKSDSNSSINWKQNRNCPDHDYAAFIQDRVAQGEGADDPDPDLAQFLRQIEQWFSKLRVHT